MADSLLLSCRSMNISKAVLCGWFAEKAFMKTCDYEFFDFICMFHLFDVRKSFLCFLSGGLSLLLGAFFISIQGSNQCRSLHERELCASGELVELVPVLKSSDVAKRLYAIVSWEKVFVTQSP